MSWRLKPKPLARLVAAGNTFFSLSSFLKTFSPAFLCFFPFFPCKIVHCFAFSGSLCYSCAWLIVWGSGIVGGYNAPQVWTYWSTRSRSVFDPAGLAGEYKRGKPVWRWRLKLGADLHSGNWESAGTQHGRDFTRLNIGPWKSNICVMDDHSSSIGLLLLAGQIFQAILFKKNWRIIEFVSCWVSHCRQINSGRLNIKTIYQQGGFR